MFSAASSRLPPLFGTSNGLYHKITPDAPATDPTINMAQQQPQPPPPSQPAPAPNSTGGGGGGGGGGVGGSFKDRNCPNMRNCWSFSWEAYSLRTSDKAALLRRICMWLILGARTASSVIRVVYDVAHGHVESWILGIIIGVVGFFFIAWCLANIGQAEGRRKVFGIMVGRWHFDVFLLVTAFIHVAMLIGIFFGLGSAGGHATWLIMWLLIFGVSWVCRWPPEPESYA